MTDNRESQEAATVRERSEFIKRIEDFARYIQKEYTTDSSDRSLLICAGERNINGPYGGMMHVVLGDRMLTTDIIANIMRNEDLNDIFRIARIESMEDDMEDMIKEKRKRLRMGYIRAGVVAFWTLCLIGFFAVGIANWITTVSNILLMVFCGFLIWREIRSIRKTVARMKEAAVKESEERLKYHVGALLSEMMKGMKRSDDEED